VLLSRELRETEVIDAWSKIVGEFIAAHSAPVVLRDGILYVRVLQPALHYELEQISKPEILRKLKQRFGGKPSATFDSASAEAFHPLRHDCFANRLD
jgi:predicted nucleic acid-binding Zn ribbon protein